MFFHFCITVNSYIHSMYFYHLLVPSVTKVFTLAYLDALPKMVLPERCNESIYQDLPIYLLRFWSQDNSTGISEILYSPSFKSRDISPLMRYELNQSHTGIVLYLLKPENFQKGSQILCHCNESKNLLDLVSSQVWTVFSLYICNLGSILIFCLFWSIKAYFNKFKKLNISAKI